jgi:superfamily II DNA helicase RecQ
MAAAGIVLVEDATFEKADRVIAYRKVSLTREGFNVNERRPLELLLATNRMEDAEPAKPKRRKSAAGKQPERMALSPAETALEKQQRPEPRKAPDPATFSAEEAALAKRLRAWRLAEAKKLGLPAFCVLSNQTLHSIVQARPATRGDLLGIYGIGAAKVERYGQSILQICALPITP